jgi:hypothetical protein
MNTYSLNELAPLVCKSANLIYRRLTEKPPRYRVRFARREGGRWVWDRKQVDEAIAKGESIIIPVDSPKTIDDDAAIAYFMGESMSCGRHKA